MLLQSDSLGTSVSHPWQGPASGLVLSALLCLSCPHSKLVVGGPGTTCPCSYVVQNIQPATHHVTPILLNQQQQPLVGLVLGITKP